MQEIIFEIYGMVTKKNSHSFNCRARFDIINYIWENNCGEWQQHQQQLSILSQRLLEIFVFGVLTRLRPFLENIFLEKFLEKIAFLEKFGASLESLQSLFRVSSEKRF
jgi:hypothetical protein